MLYVSRFGHILQADQQVSMVQRIERMGPEVKRCRVLFLGLPLLCRDLGQVTSPSCIYSPPPNHQSCVLSMSDMGVSMLELEVSFPDG